MEKKHIFLASPTMNGKEMQYIEEAFRSNWIAPLGKNVDNFEMELASYVGCSHAAALSSGTAAIHLAIKLAGVKHGDIVFVSSLTFAATCNPVIYENATPVFIDSEPDTWNMCPEALKSAFNKYPDAKAVIIVNLYGTPGKLDEIKNICEQHQVPLIEDAAESLGSMYRGKQTGTIGDYGIYSFNGNKLITTSGGGMLVSNNGKDIEKARFWATQSRDPARHYQHSEIGYNYRMSNIVAGIGRGQLHTIDTFIHRKQAIYTQYQEELSEIPYLKMNPISAEDTSNHWLSCILLDLESPVTPTEILIKLEKEDIESRPIWKPMNLQPVFSSFDFIQVDSSHGLSICEDIYNRGLCLPSDIKNTQDDMIRIIQTIKSVFR